MSLKLFSKSHEYNEYINNNNGDYTKDEVDEIINTGMIKITGIDPNKIFNAGSFFKNPIVKKSDISYSFFKSDNLITWEVDKTYVKVGAARLIELVKDKIIPSDNVSIYKNHSLVLVTNGRATQNEVLAFASQIQELISKFFNINLELEPTVIK